MVMAPFICRDKLSGINGAALDMLPHAASWEGTLVIAARMVIAFHQFLSILAPPAMACCISLLTNVQCHDQGSRGATLFAMSSI